MSNQRSLWITVAHPGMKQTDTIGDMVRLKTISRAAQACGWETRIVLLNQEISDDLGQTGNGGNGSAWKMRAKGVIPHAAWMTTKDILHLRSSVAFESALRQSSACIPDLIIDYNTYLSRAAIRFAREKSIPVVSNLEAFPWDAMDGVEASFLRSFGRRYEISKYAEVDAVWAVSEPLADAVHRLAPSQQNVRCLPNAYDPPSHTASPTTTLEIPPGPTVVGFVGGISKWPCLDRLGEVCHRLRRRGHDLHLLIVGDGPERRSLEVEFEAKGEGWFSFTGLASREEVPAYINLFDVAVIPNHKWWTSPLKLLEYGAHSRAVVAPDLPSITTMVSDDEVVFFRNGDWGHLSDRLEMMLTDARCRREFGGRLAEKVASRYSFASMVKRLGLLLREAAG